jgi:hypothetical protein
MTARALVLSLFVIFAAAPGCSTPKPSGYLTDYGRLDKGQFLERYFADQDAIEEGRYGRIFLSSVSTDRVRDRGNIAASQCATWLREALGASEGKALLESPWPTGASAELDVSITEMNPGSATARILAGEFGAGHAWVQVEGKVTDPRTGATLAAFAERRRSSGAIGFKDVGGDSGPALVRDLVSEIGADIRRALAASFDL